MTKTVFALAALAAIGFSGVALAEEAATTPMGPVQMTDSELDGVTAGGHELGVNANPQCGIGAGQCGVRAGVPKRNPVGGDLVDRGEGASGNDKAAQFAPLGPHPD